jgi:hypothetical protein
MPIAQELYQPTHGTLSILCIGPIAFVECIMHFCKKKGYQIGMSAKSLNQTDKMRSYHSPIELD